MRRTESRKLNRNENAGPIYWVAAIFAFAIAVFCMVRHNLSTFESLYLQSNDGDLYLNIAENFLNKGHFLQDLRPFEHFVVPPGLPFMCTLLTAIGGLKGLLIFQYAVYGCTAAIMAMCCCEVCGRAKLPVQILAGIAAPALYLYCCFKIRHPNPCFVLTENYVLFLLCLLLFMLLRHRSGASLIPVLSVLFVLFLFRPACSGLLVIGLIAAVLQALGVGGSDAKFGSNSAKNSGKKAKIRNLAITLAVFALVIGVNTAVNYRETGHIITIEDYSTMDIYLANNEVAGPDSYHSGKLYDFGTEEFKAIYDDASMCYYEKNEAASELLNEYLKHNMPRTVKFACVRYNQLFCGTWGALWWAFLGCAILLFWRRCISKHGSGSSLKAAVLLLAFVLLTVVPSFGLLVARYSAPTIPLFVFCIVGAACSLANGRDRG